MSTNRSPGGAGRGDQRATAIRAGRFSPGGMPRLGARMGRTSETTWQGRRILPNYAEHRQREDSPIRLNNEGVGAWLEPPRPPERPQKLLKASGSSSWRLCVEPSKTTIRPSITRAMASQISWWARADDASSQSAGAARPRQRRDRKPEGGLPRDRGRLGRSHDHQPEERPNQCSHAHHGERPHHHLRGHQRRWARSPCVVPVCSPRPC